MLFEIFALSQTLRTNSVIFGIKEIGTRNDTVSVSSLYCFLRPPFRPRGLGFISPKNPARFKCRALVRLAKPRSNARR